MKKIACFLLLFQGGMMMAQTETVPTINGKKIQVTPNGLGTADNGLTVENNNVQLGGSLKKATTLVTSSSATLALKGLQAGAAADNVLVLDAGGVIKSIARSSFGGSVGDNLGDHTATKDLKMSAQSITGAKDITAAGKTSTGTAAIAKGTDGAVPKAGYIATAADDSGNVVWKENTNAVIPTEIGTVISIGGKLQVAQEITAQMAADFVKTTGTSTITPIGNITNVIIDNKSKFTSSAAGNSFTVDADGTYLVTLNAQVISATVGATYNQSIVLGIRDNTTGQWVARVNDSYNVENKYQTFTLMTSIQMVASHSYTFATAGNFTHTIVAFSSGTTGSGPVTFYSVKRIK